MVVENSYECSVYENYSSDKQLQQVNYYCPAICSSSGGDYADSIDNPYNDNSFAVEGN